MTAKDLMISAYRTGGEPSDLCPYITPGDFTTFDDTLATAGAKMLLAYVNRGILRIANWVFSDGTILRFRSLIDRRPFYGKCAASSGRTVSQILGSNLAVEAFISDFDGRYDGYVIEASQSTSKTTPLVIRGLVVDTYRILSQRDLIMTIDGNVFIGFDDYPNVNLRFMKSWVDLIKATYNLIAYGSINIATYSVSDILKVRNLTTKIDLVPSDRTDWFTANIATAGSPTEYFFQGGRIYLNALLDADENYEVLLYRNPNPLVNASDLLGLPESFHDAVALWTAHQLLLDQHDFDGAYAIKRDLQEMMQTLRLQGALEKSFESMSLFV